MNKAYFKKTLLTIAIGCLMGGILIAQSPSADLDSITEDSYQRMQERQKKEEEVDSLQNAVKRVGVNNEMGEGQQNMYYLVGGLLIVAAGLRWYFKLYGKKKK